jgi:uncharacterized protein YodC (DUF2158 family)
MNVGDVVRLKSGGPPMTVTRLESSAATCEWFTSIGTEMFTAETTSRQFPVLALEPVTSGAPT